MAVVVVTGSSGLIGSEAVAFFCEKGFDVVGLDNDMRAYFFGGEASTAWNRERLKRAHRNFTPHEMDIRNFDAVKALFARHGKAISAVVHTAAQPSHDWAAREPLTDFSVNATGTLNLLEATRLHAPEAAFVFTSTNKVYGDQPNALPLVEQETRWEVAPGHRYAADGIDESMSIDNTLHSVFGASKVAADVMVQEYGRYFGLRSACFRGGCLTGPHHAGAKLHGFLAYLGKCAVTGEPYTVLGYKGKQVRDNIHSADLVDAFWHFVQAPRSGEVYNMGGGRFANCSMLEAITLFERATGRAMNWSYSDDNRTGDHIWWISDTGKFERHYPSWKRRVSLEATVSEIVDAVSQRRLATS
ncbi:MAG: NAD-dependent epimerase/dehydratase family protein [Proteobacteria bacterium]|nr:NAD-dependent epimerase/dehydratase family protein [Pseudomonadota bacterium]